MSLGTSSIPGSGGQAEQLAVEHLLQAGYTIRERNFRNRMGEIDIIANDGNILCFVEVKFRSDEAQGHPLEAVTPSKQRKLSLMALSYLQQAEINDDQIMRFDVVSITLANDICDVEICKSAFESVL